MIRCPRCDHFNPDGTAACERCATALVPTEIEPAPQESRSALALQVLAIVATGGKIAAIKWYREQTGLGLKEAKDAVESLMRQHNVAPPKSGCAGMVLALALLTTLFSMIGR